MLVTEWRDLGDGRDRFNPKMNPDQHRSDLREVDFTPGSICAKFEEKRYEGFGFDNLLTLKTKARLLLEAYLCLETPREFSSR